MPAPSAVRTRRRMSPGVCIEHRDRNRGDDPAPPRHPSQAEHGEIADRHDERQRVAARERFLEQEIEDDVRPERRHEQGQRTAIATRRPHDSRRRRGEHHDRNRPRGPRRDERVVQRLGHRPHRMRRPQHRDVAEVLSALIRQRAPIGRRAAGDHDHWNKPDHHAGGERGQHRD